MSTPVALLHPLGSDRGFWDSVRQTLRTSVRAPDLLGHGRAPLPSQSPTITEYADAVAAELRGAPHLLVGVSLGGLIAQDLAVRHPEVAKGVVLIATVATYPQSVMQSWQDRAYLARRHGLESLVEGMEESWFSPAFCTTHPEVVERVRNTLLRTPVEGYARTCMALAGVDLTGSIHQMSVPGLSLCGDQDAAWFVDAARHFADSLTPPPGQPRKVRWLASSRHAAVLEHPEEVALLINEFVAAVDDRT